MNWLSRRLWAGEWLFPSARVLWLYPRRWSIAEVTLAQQSDMLLPPRFVHFPPINQPRAPEWPFEFRNWSKMLLEPALLRPSLALFWFPNSCPLCGVESLCPAVFAVFGFYRVYSAADEWPQATSELKANREKHGETTVLFCLGAAQSSRRTSISVLDSL